MTAPAFDVERHRRERLARLERQTAGLLRYRQKQERVLALAVLALGSATGCDPLNVLWALDAIDELPERVRPDVVEILRETKP